MKIVWCIVFTLTLNVINAESDSYIKALSLSRVGSVKKGVIYVTASNNQVTTPIPNRREDGNYDTGPNAEPNSYEAFTSNDAFNNYQDSYLPQSTYAPPKKYGVPAMTYGVPHNTYGPPSYKYGPPAPMYGPPKPMYGVPYEAPSFFDKFALKLDLVTLAKILLKLLIFKKIIKFIAIMCLLLFIPKLIHIKKNKDDDDDERAILNIEERTTSNLDLLTAFVQQAIDVYSLQQKGCEDMGCRFDRMLDHLDERYAFVGMRKMFEEPSERPNA